MAGAALTTRHRVSQALQEHASLEQAQPEAFRPAATVGGLLRCIARALGFFMEDAGGADDGRERLRRTCCRAQGF